MEDGLSDRCALRQRWGWSPVVERLKFLRFLAQMWFSQPLAPLLNPPNTPLFVEQWVVSPQKQRQTQGVRYARLPCLNAIISHMDPVRNRGHQINYCMAVTFISTNRKGANRMGILSVSYF